MSNNILGDTREVFDGYAGTQGVLDTNELYKRSRQNKSFTNSGVKYLGTQDTGGTTTNLQVLATDINDNLGNPGHAEPENYITHFGIYRRVRHTTSTAVNFVISCNNESNSAINDTDNHYAYARIAGTDNSTSGSRGSGDSSQYYASWGYGSGFTTANPNHTLAGVVWVSNLGRQFRNLTAYIEVVGFTNKFEATQGCFTFDHVDDNADDVPAVLNLTAYTGNAAYKKFDYYGVQEPHAIIMD